MTVKRTDKPRNRTKKLSNAPLKPYKKIALSQPLPVVLNPVLKTAFRHTKTPWQWRTDTPRNRTKKVSNVPFETLLKIAFCQFCQPFPVVLPPVLKTALRHTKTPCHEIAPKNSLTSLWNPIKNSLLPILPTFSRCTASGAENSPPPHQNTMAVKDGHATK